MPLAFLNATSYDQIRGALDLTLGQAQLPDEVIQQSIYGPAAEGDLLDLDPAAGGYAEGTLLKERSIRAVIYLTAARLALSYPAVMLTAVGDFKVQKSPQDLALLARSLRGLAAREIALNTGTSKDRIQQQFWLAAGRRGA